MSHTDTFDVSEGAAYAVLYSVLSFFTLLAVLTAGYCGASSSGILDKLGMRMKPAATGDGEESGEATSADFFLAARNSAGSRSIALSFFASGMGAWVVYGSTEMGANPQLSWFGVLGYSAASACPALIVCAIGPRVREVAGEDAFATTDFGLVRYGRVMQVAIAGISVFYMFIFLVSEMTSISNVYARLVGLSTEGDANASYTTAIAVSLAVFTWFYTSLAGLPASIVTDKFQAALMFFLVLVLLLVATISPENRITKEEFALASNWTVDGIMAAVTLFVAIASAEMFNQGTWQRVWAAKTVGDMRRGFAMGSFLVFLLMMFFGIMGMVAYANDPEAYDNNEKLAYLAFFDLILPLSTFWHILVLIIVTALAASSVDTLQTAIASVFSSDLLNLGLSDNTARFITRVVLVIINIPAVIMSSKRFDVIGLFLIADLVCATAVLPVFLGLITTDLHFFLPAPTELGAFLGIWSGIAAVVVNGQIIDFGDALNPYTEEVIATGPFAYFWLTNSAQCALCGKETMITFLVTPIVAGVCTLLFSRIDILVRGERAREPLFASGREEGKNYRLGGDTKNVEVEDEKEEKDVVVDGDHQAVDDEVETTKVEQQEEEGDGDKKSDGAAHEESIETSHHAMEVEAA